MVEGGTVGYCFVGLVLTIAELIVINLLVGKKGTCGTGVWLTASILALISCILQVVEFLNKSNQSISIGTILVMAGYVIFTLAIFIKVKALFAIGGAIVMAGALSYVIVNIYNLVMQPEMVSYFGSPLAWFYQCLLRQLMGFVRGIGFFAIGLCRGKGAKVWAGFIAIWTALQALVSCVLFNQYTTTYVIIAVVMELIISAMFILVGQMIATHTFCWKKKEQLNGAAQSTVEANPAAANPAPAAFVAPGTNVTVPTQESHVMPVHVMPQASPQFVAPGAQIFEQQTLPDYSISEIDNILSQLEKLSDYKNNGVITAEDIDIQKQRILRRKAN